MFVRVLVALSICLAAITGYLLHTHGKETKSLREQIHTLEVKIARTESECETKTSLLRAEKQSSHERNCVQEEKKPLADLVRRLPINPLSQIDGTLAAMREALMLDNDQIRQIMLVLDTFNAERNNILTNASKEKIFILNPKTARLVGEARQRALEKTRTILTEEQYNGMVEKGFDVRLGLKIAPPSTPS